MTQGKTLMEVFAEEDLPPDAQATVSLETSSFSMSYRKAEYPVVVLLPYIPGGFPGPVVASLLYYAKHLDLGFELQGNTVIQSARNELAARFLRSDAEWSFWLDSDVFMPYGNAAAFQHYSQTKRTPTNFAAYNTIRRLLAHNQPLVGGVYAGRGKGGPLVIQPEMEPRQPNDAQISAAIRQGKSAGGLQPVTWIAAGLMLVHRKVYQRIMETQPEHVTPGNYYPFFTQFANRGEDVAFCDRARKAGFQPLLDTEVRAGHIGQAVFVPEDSAPPVRLGGK
jgi:hypothetical protein